MAEKNNVFNTYNKIADWFAENRSTHLIEEAYLQDIIQRIPADGHLLDIGCGTGLPIYGYFYEKGYGIKGVDASVEMLRHAHVNFPDGDFLQADMRLLNLPEQFDALLAWHSFFHLPAEDQREMFPIFRKHLKDDGILLFTTGPAESEAWADNAGELLYHASLAEQDYKSLLAENGFQILKHQVEDPSCGGATVWLAQYKSAIR